MSMIISQAEKEKMMHGANINMGSNYIDTDMVGNRKAKKDILKKEMLSEENTKIHLRNINRAKQILNHQYGLMAMRKSPEQEECFVNRVADILDGPILIGPNFDGDLEGWTRNED